MIKKKLLVCIPDFPFPARKNGISIRYAPILEHASKEFDIHLVVIANGNVNAEAITDAQKICSKISVYVRQPQSISLYTKLKARIKSLFPIGVPFGHVHYDQEKIAQFIKKETGETLYDLALSVLITHQHLVKKYVKAKRYTLDVIDSPYSTSLRNPRKTLLNAYDTLMIKYWERRAINSVDYACYISPLDRMLGAGSHVQKIGVIPNGLYLHDYTEEKINYQSKTIGYLGHMGYPPNIRAAQRLYSIFKSRENELENCKLIIIGRDPAPEIQNLGQDANVLVTGSVENIWPYVNGIDIFVFPMDTGSGQQNKLLEAMGAAKAVISSQLGNSGIGASHSNEILIANSDQEIGDALVKLTNTEDMAKQIGINAKKFIDRTFSWQAIYQILDTTLLKSH